MVRTNQAPFVELPPAAWLEFSGRPRQQVDPAELNRATWFWDRRPRYVLADGAKILWGRILLFGLVILLLSAFDVPGLLIAAGLGFFGANVADLRFVLAYPLATGLPGLFASPPEVGEGATIRR